MLDLELTQETELCATCPPYGIYRVARDERQELAFFLVPGASMRYMPVLIRMDARQAD